MTVRAAASRRGHLACVLGDIDLVAALGRSGVRSVAVVPHNDPAAFSRHTVGRLEPADHWREPAVLVDRLVAWAARQTLRPVLYYQTDGDLLLVSRHRERLGSAFRFVVADADLVETLVDKVQFAALAQRLGLPVPRSRRLRASDPPDAVDLEFPLILKPLLRRDLVGMSIPGKAVRVDTPDALQHLWPRMTAAGIDVLAQQAVPGPESRIESYHAYVDQRGAVVADFTGVKLRTHPLEYGQTTALRITQIEDVRRIGQDVVARLKLSGVVKVDFKRDPQGRLVLLEVNPRFTLWNYAGALAGVNLPLFVHADLVGLPRPPSHEVRDEATWCHPAEDRHAAAALGMTRLQWLSFTARSDARHAADLRDPLPFARGVAWPALRRRLARAPAV
jgi:predicted ATP-grasp superfamily ATP-dependent carboligase